MLVVGWVYHARYAEQRSASATALLPYSSHNGPSEMPLDHLRRSIGPPRHFSS